MTHQGGNGKLKTERGKRKAASKRAKAKLVFERT